MRLLLLSVAITFTVTQFSCTKIPIQFGSEFVDNENTQIIKIDTFSVELSTIHVDSFITSSSGESLIGQYNDSAFGKIETKSFFELSPLAYSDVFSNTIFDSLSLIITLNKKYYGDSSKPLQLNVNQLSEEIEFRENESVFYNTQQVNITPLPIGTRTQLVRPHQTDTIAIRLNDALGKQLLTKLQDVNDEDMQLADKFNAYFKGLCISSGQASNIIIGCKDSIIMRLHYKKKGLFLDEKTFDFLMQNKQHHFNNIITNRVGTALENLNSRNNTLPSSISNNASYLQYVSGSMIKIRFSNIKNLLKSANYNKLLRAQLMLKPIKKTFDSYYFLPKELCLAETNLLNKIGNYLTTFDANRNQIIQYGNLTQDFLLGDNTTYVYEITNYIQNRLQDIGDNENGLLLIPPPNKITSDFARVIIGNNKHINSKSIVEIYYLKVN